MRRVGKVIGYPPLAIFPVFWMVLVLSYPGSVDRVNSFYNRLLSGDLQIPLCEIVLHFSNITPDLPKSIALTAENEKQAGVAGMWLDWRAKGPGDAPYSPVLARQVLSPGPRDATVAPRLMWARSLPEGT